MDNFKEKLITYCKSNQKNQFINNYDYRRFGKEKNHSLKTLVKSILEKTHLRPNKVGELIDSHSVDLQWLYKSLQDEESKSLLVSLLAYRILGYRKVKSLWVIFPAF